MSTVLGIDNDQNSLRSLRLVLEEENYQVFDAKDAETARTLAKFITHAERQFILQHVNEFNWNISQTAVSLAIERTTLHKKLKQWGIERP